MDIVIFGFEIPTLILNEFKTEVLIIRENLKKILGLKLDNPRMEVFMLLLGIIQSKEV
ncbi:hypothetical protein ACQ1QD_11775 [Ornithobacterium rhinotracheale]